MSWERAEGEPPGWVLAKVADVAQVEMGQSPPSSSYNSTGRGLPFFQGKAEFGTLYPEPRVWCSEPSKLAEVNDVLLSVRAPVGPTNLAPARCSIGRGLAAIRPEAGLDLKYLLYAFRRYAAELDARGTGTTFKAVSGRTIREFCIPVAPEGEQIRIGDALDELLSDLDAGVVLLERVHAKLAQYRASVLKAAVDGTLTADWRAAHQNTEPASELLERILSDRRRRWEEEQLQTFKEKRREPPKNWKAKYKEPVEPATDTMPQLPRGWCWATVAQCALVLQYGTSSKATRDVGVPVLRMGNLTADGRLALDSLKYLPSAHSEFPELLLQAGDLLFNRTNSAELVGKTAQYQGQPAPCSFASYLIRVRLAAGIYPQILVYVMTSMLGRNWVKAAANQTVGQANVNGTKLAGFVWPVPPSIEQEAIVALVEDHLSVIEQLESDINAKLMNAQALRQALLRHAFCGLLVEQDPNDEPASELLKRIAAERQSHARKVAAHKILTGRKSDSNRPGRRESMIRRAETP